MTTRLTGSNEDQAQLRSHPPGSGHLHLTASSTRATFSTLFSSYPLKILTPSPLPSQPLNVASCYTLAYGGGLVAGDLVSLRVEVDESCGLVMLTQGSTKVFKHRLGIRPRSHSTSGDSNPVTRQRIHVTLAPKSFILSLPDSVSPFRGSRYFQAQRFVLPSDGNASVLLLDWVNSGRGQQRLAANGSNHDEEEEEIWAMESYNSLNEIYLSDRQIMRDRLLLDATISPVAPRMRPFNVYATILIFGPTFASLLKHLKELGDRTSQFQAHRPPEMVWAFSPVEAEQGGVVRVAGVEVEDVRKWIRKTLQSGGIENLVGQGLWPRLI
ncbi:MAG: hypothetical protein TREMPRED_004601 [Tremellales sp. Tagirdzhanova-0007]|nr:MAG: hypothetical protein TREMPRED_004601 [Tremellales sp. Tagirdzhanova-0007]